MSEARESGRVIIHADGRSDAEGVCSWAFVARIRGGGRHEASGLVENPYGEPTSLIAEWVAAVEALRWVRERAPGTSSMLLRVDSALVEKGLKNRRLSVSGYEGALAIEARDHLAALKREGVHVHVERVPRWRNADADGLTQEAAAAEPALGEDGDGPELVPGIPPPSRRVRRAEAARRT